LAEVYQDAGRLTEALPMFEEVLKVRKVRMGPKHPRTLESMNSLAGAYQAAGRTVPVRVCQVRAVSIEGVAHC
jgi:hypothetical protein